MATAVNLKIDGRAYFGSELECEVAATTIIYCGQLVFANANGWAQSTAYSGGALRLLGIAKEMCDNSAGGNGTNKVLVYRRGWFRHLTFTGTATQAIKGAAIHAVDNNTIQLSATSAAYVGVGTLFLAAAQIELEIDTLTRTLN